MQTRLLGATVCLVVGAGSAQMLGCKSNKTSDAAPAASTTAATSAPAKAADVTPLTSESAVRAWNDALNRHDLEALRAAYAPDVLFYGRQATSAEVVAAKAQAFARDPDFQQEVSDFAASETADTVTVRFTKAWTTKGVTRRVVGSLGLKRAGGHFLVTAETDVATSEPQAKGSWRCGRCRNTEKTGPDLVTSDGVKPEYFAWILEVTSADGSRKSELGDASQSVDLGGLAGWSCSVGAAQGHVVKGPMEESSSFYVEDRQLYCVQIDGGSARLISDVECSPRGSGTDSDFMELSPGNKVQLACATPPSP